MTTMTETVIVADGTTTTFAYEDLLSVEWVGQSVIIVLAKAGVQRSPIVVFDEEALAEDFHARVLERWDEWLEGY